MKALIPTVLLILALPLAAQTGIPVSGSTTACAFHYLTVTNPCTDETESLTFLNYGATKDNQLLLSAKQTLVPGATVSVYEAGAQLLPEGWLASLLAKSNIPADSLSFGVGGFGGIATTPTGNQGAFEGQATIGYAFNPNVGLTSAYGGGGMIGSHGFWKISAGLNLSLNPLANKSALIQTSIRKATAAKAAKDAAK